MRRRRLTSRFGEFLQRNYERALEIIRKNRESLVALANTLLDVETLDRETFERLMNEPPPLPEAAA